jgi:DNA modification methylase
VALLMEPFWSHMLPRPYFERDGISLFHADSREMLPELEGESFDMALTDPPYLVSYVGRWGSDWTPIEGDSDPSWVKPVYSQLWRLLKPDSLCLTFTDGRTLRSFLVRGGSWALGH